MNQNKSSAGDWLFLIGSIGLVCGYFIYENSANVAAWLQVLANAPIIPSSGLLAFLIGNWGLVFLIAAIIFAVFKLWVNGTTSTTGDGRQAKFRRYRYVNVNLVR